MRRKIQAFLKKGTPEKEWDLPEYAEVDAKDAELGQSLTWEMKGRCLLSGVDRNFVRNSYVDDEADSTYTFESSEDDSSSGTSEIEVHVPSQEG